MQAITWVLEEAPGLKPHLVGTLIGLANHADRDGRGAYPSQATLAWYARKADRNVRSDLAALQDISLIRRGDQRIAAHIPADERPIVWDLAIELKRPRREQDEMGPDAGIRPNQQKDRMQASGRTSTSGRMHSAEGPDAHIRRGPDAGIRQTVPVTVREPTTSHPAYQSPGTGEPAADQPPTRVEQLVAWYRDSSPRGIPSRQASRIASEAHQLIADGFTDDEIRAGLTELRTRQLGPACLPSLVDELANGPTPGAKGRTSRTQGQDLQPVDVGGQVVMLSARSREGLAMAAHLRAKREATEQPAITSSPRDIAIAALLATARPAHQEETQQ